MVVSFYGSHISHMLWLLMVVTWLQLTSFMCLIIPQIHSNLLLPFNLVSNWVLGAYKA
jgi:hypothetical protein